MILSFYKQQSSDIVLWHYYAMHYYKPLIINLILVSRLLERQHAGMPLY